MIKPSTIFSLIMLLTEIFHTFSSEMVSILWHVLYMGISVKLILIDDINVLLNRLS